MRRTLSLELLGDRFLPAISSFSAEEEERRKKLLQTLNQAIEKELTQRQQYCLQKYYFENITMGCIAKELGITEATVSRHLKKARQRLSKILIYVFPRLQ